MALSLKPNHTSVKAYYETLHQFGQLYIDHEGAVRSAFQTLLAKCGQKASPKLTLVPEYRIARAKKSSVIVDGALVDLYHLPHGYWEAKDEKDDLLREVQRKLDEGYPADNIIFQAPERAILYQNSVRVFDENITRPEALVDVVNRFFEYKMPRIEEWQRAVDEFSERVPELSKSVEKLIKEERLKSPAFSQAFSDFYALCQQAINPNLSEDAVERMLVQHLLTERILRKIFNNPDLSKRNVVAAEIEKVITELTRRAFNRDEFLKRLEPFYHAIETNADNATGFTEKQSFLNTVYERFFQGYSPKEADTHGIVYTPQPIVNFMVRSVEEILQKEFGRSLSDKGVHILDPFVGTGNFPFYTYAEDGTNRRENITDSALEQFRSHYGDPSITKWDIFHYVYAVLHHPEYRQRYAANLRRELPRIPFVGTSGAKALVGGDANAAINGRSSTNPKSSARSTVEERPFRAASDAPSSTLSSRAQQDDSLANHPAESRDPALAGDEHRRDREFSAQNVGEEVRGKNSPTRSSNAHADTRSFDSVSGRTSVPTHSAQDDRAGEMSDIEVFRAFAKAGQRLAEIHVHYEQQPEYPLTKTEKAGEKLDYRVEKMKLSKDKTTLIYNRFLTLSGIPKETYEYRLGNRSALEWVIDQYQVSTDKRSGITNDPNRADDPTYILRLIGQVVTVSLETVKIVGELPKLGLPRDSESAAGA